MLVSWVCLQEQKKQSFLTLAKKNQSPLGLHGKPQTFFFTNPRFVFLIRDWCFVLLSLSSTLLRSSLITEWKWEKSVYNVLNMDIFLTKNTTGGVYSPPEPCEACFIMDGCTLFDFFWTVEQKHPFTAIIKLGRARIIFNIALIGFVWKEKVIYT